MLKIRSKVCCHFGSTSQGDVVGRVSAHYITLLIYTCFCAYTVQGHYRHAPQQTKTSGAKFKILKCSKQTLPCTLSFSPAIYFSPNLTPP
jgi:hypothetical protein